jgi:hypothetical protein
VVTGFFYVKIVWSFLLVLNLLLYHSYCIFNLEGVRNDLISENCNLNVLNFCVLWSRTHAVIYASKLPDCYDKST